MRVYVKVFATLVRLVRSDVSGHGPSIRAGSRLEVDLPEESTLDGLLDHLALPREKVRVIFVNGRAQPRDYRLQPGDEVGIFPPIGGG
jgi:molybdopterin synthase sulfur carrier subunit